MKLKLTNENYNVADLNGWIYLNGSLGFYEGFYAETLGLIEQRCIEAPDYSYIIVFPGNSEFDALPKMMRLKDYPQKYN